MTALASIADYEAITGIDVAAGADTTRATTLLGLASEAVLAGAGGQAILTATYTNEVIRPHEGVGYFTQRPVTAVASVTLNGELLVEGTDYRWTAGGNGRPATLIRQYGGVDSYWSNLAGFQTFTGSTDEILVTYTAGWATVPGQIKAIVVAMAKAMYDLGGDRQATSEGVGPFSATYDEARSTSLELTESDRRVIAQLCGVRGPGSVHLRAGA
jgi:hypothetical protein